MLNDLKDIYIKKRTPVQWITMFIVILPLLLQALLQFFNFPSAIKYTIDIAWIAAMLWIVFSKRIKINRKVLPFVVFVAVFFCYCLIISIYKLVKESQIIGKKLLLIFAYFVDIM